MIDHESRIRALMVSLPKITAKFGQRVYAARSLPAGYKPEQGPALLFTTRGGTQLYHSRVLVPSVQMRVYGATEAMVRGATQALYDALNDTKSLDVPYIRMENGTLPTLINEPNVGWPFMLLFFTFHILNS